MQLESKDTKINNLFILFHVGFGTFKQSLFSLMLFKFTLCIHSSDPRERGEIPQNLNMQKP